MMTSAQAAPAMLPEVGYMPMPLGFEYKSVFLHGRPKHRRYDDFWRKHPPMDVTHRAKIFAPFAALAGFDDWIHSKETLYTDRRELSESEKENINRKIAVLETLTRNGREARKNRPAAAITYFIPCTDTENFAYGTQGRYETVTGIVSKVDMAVSRTISISGQVIPLEFVSGITIVTEHPGLPTCHPEPGNTTMAYHESI